MLRYITVRLFHGIIVIFLISIITFVMLRLMPGDPAYLLLGEGQVRISAQQMDATAALADEYNFGEVRVSHRQNLTFTDVRQNNAYELWQKLTALDLATANIGKGSDIIACPGLDYCALANARSILVIDCRLK